MAGVVVAGDVVGCSDIEGMLLKTAACVFHVVARDVLAESVIRTRTVHADAAVIVSATYCRSYPHLEPVRLTPKCCVDV